jgi:hypothetical protein
MINPALKQIRDATGMPTREQVSVTDTGSSSSSKTFGEWIGDNPATNIIDQTQRDRIPDKYRDMSVEKVKELAEPFQGLEEQLGTDVEPGAPAPDNGAVDQPIIDDQKIQDLINPVPSLQGKLDTPDFEVPDVEAPGFELPGMPEIPQPQVNLDLGLGKIAKFGATTIIAFLVIREVF